MKKNNDSAAKDLNPENVLNINFLTDDLIPFPWVIELAG